MADEPINWRNLTIRLHEKRPFFLRKRGDVTLITYKRRKGAPKFNQEQIDFMGEDFYQAKLSDFYARSGDKNVPASLAALARASRLGKAYAAAANDIKDARQAMALELAVAGEPVVDIAVASGVNKKTLQESWFVGLMPTGEMKPAPTDDDPDKKEEVRELSLLVPKEVMEATEKLTLKEIQDRAKVFNPLAGEDDEAPAADDDTEEEESSGDQELEEAVF